MREERMIIKSMTGYGKGTSEISMQKLSIEFKSVNHRFLDLNIKLPKGFTFAEDLIRKVVKSAITRGHIDIFVNYEDNRKDKTEIVVDLELAKNYYDCGQEIARQFGIEQGLKAVDIMKFPDVVSQNIKDTQEDVLIEMVTQATSQAIESLNVMRATEGESMRNDIVEKLEYIQQLVRTIEEYSPMMVAEHKQKVQERITEMLAGIPLDQAKLANELAYYSDKVCVDEELTRLNSHLTHFKDILAKGGVVGKQLDFIVQEMNRESNTIGSKCSNINVTNCVLELKGAIEKIREQIQNIE